VSLAKRIIPCLDIDKGRVVKGVKFLDVKQAGDPVEVARRYDRQGADELVFLDITASHEDRGTLMEIVEQVAGEVFIPLTVGGGVRSLADVRRLLSAGADKVSINTAAINNPDFIGEAAARYGSQCIVTALDAKRVSKADEPPRWEIFTHGGRRETGIEVIGWAQKLAGLGAGEILLTSMDKDGTQSGFDVELTRAVSDTVDIPVIASGGVGDLSDLYDGLADGRADAVLAASIFHFGTYTIQEAKNFLAERGLVVRDLVSR